jgi:hypothetical protein
MDYSSTPTWEERKKAFRNWEKYKSEKLNISQYSEYKRSLEYRLLKLTKLGQQTEQRDFTCDEHRAWGIESTRLREEIWTEIFQEQDRLFVGTADGPDRARAVAEITEDLMLTMGALPPYWKCSELLQIQPEHGIIRAANFCLNKLEQLND